MNWLFINLQGEHFKWDTLEIKIVKKIFVTAGNDKLYGYHQNVVYKIYILQTFILI